MAGDVERQACGVAGHNLCRSCRFHHRMRTHRGWQLIGGPRRWALLPPPGAGVTVPRGGLLPRAG